MDVYVCISVLSLHTSTMIREPLHIVKYGNICILRQSGVPRRTRLPYFSYASLFTFVSMGLCSRLRPHPFFQCSGNNPPACCIDAHICIHNLLWCPAVGTPLGLRVGYYISAAIAGTIAIVASIVIVVPARAGYYSLHVLPTLLYFISPSVNCVFSVDSSPRLLSRARRFLYSFPRSFHPVTAGQLSSLLSIRLFFPPLRLIFLLLLSSSSYFSFSA